MFEVDLGHAPLSPDSARTTRNAQNRKQFDKAESCPFRADNQQDADIAYY